MVTKRNVRIRWVYDCGDDRARHGRTEQDIIYNTKAQAETLVKMGESIGCKYG